jgi:hypothetical protein
VTIDAWFLPALL